jgi:hypothetical protein
MPRYFFHFLDGNAVNLVRDSAGTSLPGANEAKREAVGLAQDIIRHQLHGSTWQVVVTDANADVVLRVPLSRVRRNRIKAALDLVRSIALYEPRFQPRLFTWLLTAVVFALIMESAMLSSRPRYTSNATEIRHVCRMC